MLAEHHQAITVIGAHAVILRTEQLPVAPSTTGDADLGITPGLVGTANISHTMEAAGYELRAQQGEKPSRPGQWGRGRYEVGGRRAWRETIDLIAATAISGVKGKQRRSVPVLTPGHGRMAVGNTPGIELSALDRSELEVHDFVDHARSTKLNVAGPTSLLIAKAYKLSERLDQFATRADRIRAKDAGDLWRLLEITTPDIAQQVIRKHHDSPIGEALGTGVEHLVRVINDPAVTALAQRDYEGVVDPQEITSTIQAWKGALL